MANDKNKHDRPSMIIDGKPASQADIKRINGAKVQKSDPDDRATKPLSNASRGFNLLR